MDTVLIVVGVILVTIIVFGISSGAREQRVNQLRRYERITIGMSEAEMLEIMGEGYNRSLLQNQRCKYEWRINATSSSSSAFGMRTSHYNGVKKVDIYTRNGFVEEVRPYNV